MADSVLRPEVAHTAIRVIHYAYPPALLLGFLVAQLCSSFTMAGVKSRPNPRLSRCLSWQHALVIMSFVGQAAVMIAHSVVKKGYWSTQDEIFYVLSATLVWGLMLASLIDTEKPVWYPYCGSWIFSLALDTGLLFLSLQQKTPSSPFEIVLLATRGFRIFLCATMPLLLLALRQTCKGSTEDTGLLSATATEASYGTIAPNSDSSDDESDVEERETREKMIKKLEESGNWWNYAKSFMIFWPYVWPQKDRWLQFSMFLVGLCLLAERGLNVLVPRQLGIVTNALSGDSVPWLEVSLYVFFRWLDSGSGVSALQAYLWMPIDQYSYRMITGAAYDHIMLLSYDFHSDKSSGDLYTSVTQGRSVNGFVESVLFSVLPMLVDLVVAFAYFYTIFNEIMALIVAITAILYIWITARLGGMKNQIRRDFNKAARKESSIMWETMSSWTTVSYFNRIHWEMDRYRGAIQDFQRVERNWLIGMSLLNICQSLVFTIGLLAACFLAVYLVSTGQRQVGNFVALLSYWVQLSAPLSFFANFYRKLQTQMLDAERLLELFQTKPSVTDKPDAKELSKDFRGDIAFEHVYFNYDKRKPAIQDLSFHVPAGNTVALVGETGGGKSTCLKLLFRFFDVSSGSIKVDGDDIRDLKLSSLRNVMGVVPQDPQLFNATIMDNLKYANSEATDEDVYSACRAALIHDKILSFPDRYQSKVGERGIKLSGGELQRVAIARAILKNAKIILLDEATSMVDTATERQIQKAFDELTKNRTTFVVAHRLSTVMNADMIIVIEKGEMIERGTHEELLLANGKYWQLWQKGKEIQAVSDQKESSIVQQDPYGLLGDVGPLFREEELKKELAKAQEEKPASDNQANASGASKSSSALAVVSAGQRTETQPSVSFNLGSTGRKSAAVPIRAPPGARQSAPAHGILKSPSPVPESSTPKHKASCLKPDAKEFIPASAKTARESSAPATFYWVPPSAIINDPIPLIRTPVWVPYTQSAPVRLQSPWPTYLPHIPNPPGDSASASPPKSSRNEGQHIENLIKIQQKIEQALRRAEARKTRQRAAAEIPAIEVTSPSTATPPVSSPPTKHSPSPIERLGVPPRDGSLRERQASAANAAETRREKGGVSQPGSSSNVKRHRIRGSLELENTSIYGDEILGSSSSRTPSAPARNDENVAPQRGETLSSLIEKSDGKKPLHAFRSASSPFEQNIQDHLLVDRGVSENISDAVARIKAHTYSGTPSNGIRSTTTAVESTASSTADFGDIPTRRKWYNKKNKNKRHPETGSAFPKT